MALIQCPKCGNEISDRAVQCPYCGTYPEEYNKKLLKKLNICLPDKKKMITSGLILIICIIMGSSLLIQTKNEKSEQLSNIKNIKKAAELLGKESIDGKVKCSVELDEFLNDVSLFGYAGEFTYNLTNNTTNNKIDCMVWTTEYDNDDEKEMDKIIDGLCEIYGKYDEKEVEYADIESGFQWQDVDQYSWVFSGINKKNNKIEIYWFK